MALALTLLSAGQDLRLPGRFSNNIKSGRTYPTRRLYGRILGSNHGKHYLALEGTRPNLAEGRAWAFPRIVGAFVTFLFPFGRGSSRPSSVIPVRSGFRPGE